MADSQTRYVIQHKLGAGAMGEVWLATDSLLNRPVALKYLKTSQDAPDNETFLAEARMLASLNHPNITAIYDAIFDKKEKNFCLIMEYVEGKPLSDVMAGWSGPLPLQIILEVAIDILQALQYAHGKGIVHRDIKPDNVMMQKDGIKLTDFGVAGLISLLAKGTEYMAGTPAYMSPEQIEGEATDGRADLYALGVMLFEMASGRHYPFQFNNLDELLKAHLEQSPRSLRDLVPDVPLALERATMRLLAKDPADRYASAGDAIDTLRSIQIRHKFSQSHLDLLDPEARPLVGRDDEIKQLAAIWAECQQAVQPRLLVIQGERGQGKSKLVTEFLGQHVVDQGFAALAGRCDESGAPYAPYADILATILDKQLTQKTITTEQTDRLLKQIPGLARLLNLASSSISAEESAEPTRKIVPESSGLWKALSDRLPESSSDPGQIEWQFFATVLAILTDLGPSVIFLENAAVLDEASAALTHFLLQQAQLPLLIVATCRPTKEALPWLDTLATDEYQLITLAPLPADAVKAHLTNLVGNAVPDPLVESIVERSQGNPRRIEEITQHLLDTKQLHQNESGQWLYTPTEEIEVPGDAFLPKAVLGAFTRQMEKLPKSSREALALAALLEPGPEFNFEPWLTLLGGKTNQTMAQNVLDDALKKRLLRQIGDQRYTFRPADVAKALTSTLTNTRRRELHRQIADMLLRQQDDPILVGYHYEQAGATNEAARHLELAGRQAIAVNAFDSAIMYYRRAGELAESRAALKALGYLYRLKGRPAASVRAFEQALALAQQANDVADQSRILNGLAQTHWQFDEYEFAIQRADLVLGMEGISEIERITAQSHLGMIYWLTGQLREAEAWYQQALTGLQHHGSETGLAEIYPRLGQVYLSQGRLGEAQSVFTQALELYQKSDHRGRQGYSLNHLGRVAVERGDFALAASEFASAQQIFEETHHRDGLRTVYANQGRMLLYQGQPDKALPLLTKALHLLSEVGRRHPYILSEIYLLMAQVSLAQGKIDRAKAAADDALQLVEDAENREYINLAEATLAQIYAAKGDTTAAETMYEQALVRSQQFGYQLAWLRTRSHYAQFLLEQGKADEAVTIQQETRAEADRIGLYLPGT
ncbi:MAG: protein kinase [Anaerolineae bacterium]|nr:protein kinase [Anaerolineae bacterium]